MYPSRINALVAVLVLGAGISQAASIRLPDGLSPGDKYRIAFVTEGSRNAESSKISVYNSFADSQANLPGSLTARLGTTWTVIASTQLVNAKANSSTDDTVSFGDDGVPIYLVDGMTIVAEHYDDLWDGTLGAPLQIDQFGVKNPGLVWTGSFSDGEAREFTELGALFSTLVGGSSQTEADWMTSDLADIGENHQLYAISAELTAVPEPSAFVLLLLGVLVIPANRNSSCRNCNSSRYGKSLEEHS